MKKSVTTSIITALFLLFFSQWLIGQSSNPVPPGFKLAPSNLLPVIAMPAVNVDSMFAEDAIDEHLKGHPFRFGYNHLVYYKPENSGTWTTLANGDRIWQLDIKTPGSFSINFGFSGFHLPVGAKLFVYSKDHSQILGAYTSANNTPDNFMGTELIKGDEAVLEYDEPAAVKGQSSFILFRITQGYKSLNNYLKAQSGFGAAGYCMRNINCPEFYDYASQKRSVVCLVIGGNKFCSGALVNNTSNDGTPYILTANHCLTGSTVDGTWIFRFNWEAPGCSEPGNEPSYDVINGATLIANNGASDFALVKMDSTPPPSYHAFYAGWSHSATPASSVVIIHHPEGDIKKGTRADNAVTATSYDGGNGGAQVWQIGQYTEGATEAGSSGSPLFDQNKRIVGQLYGGPSDCGASSDQLRDYYGRFNISWDSGSTAQTRLKEWLDPGNTGSVTNNGYDPYAPADSFDVELYNVLSPVNNTCNTVINPSITVANLGALAVSTITVNYYLDGNSSSSFVWTGNLVSQANTVINLPSMSVTPGSHIFYANVSLPAGSTDKNLYNDSIITSFVVYDSVASAPPLVQEFESGTFPPANWAITTPTSGTTWAASNTGGFSQSGHSTVVDEWSPAQSTIGERPSLFSTPVNLANAPNAQLFLKFDVAYAPYNLLNSDSLAIFVSNDCGANWSLIYQKGGDSLSTAPHSSTLFVPTANQWRKDSVNISSLNSQSDVLFQFQVISGYGNAMYLDNIDIADTSSTPVGFSNIAGNVSVHVFPNPFAQSFNLQFSLDAAENINVALYSMDGKKLISVLDNEKEEPGTHHVDIKTDRLSDGIYLLKVNEQFFKLEKLK